MAQYSVVEEVRRTLEARLLDGAWPAGARLPPERELADSLGVSRHSLRAAIFCLKSRGLLVSKQGSGVFVTDTLQTAIASPWRQLLADHQDLRWDTLEFRRELEGATAYYAAMRANEMDLNKIGNIFTRLIKAYDASNEADEYRADADFHEAIAEASHNSMFRFLHTGIVRMLREHINLNLVSLKDQTGEVTSRLRQQHLNIWDAIRTQQPDAARQAMLVHIDFTRTELIKRTNFK